MKMILLGLSVLVFVGCGGERNIDNEIRDRLIEWNKVSGKSNIYGTFTTLDTIQETLDTDGSIIRVITDIESSGDIYEVTIFDDVVTILPKDETN